MELIENLSPFLFWDVNKSRLDPQANAKFIVPRVMDYGTIDDVHLVLDYYSRELIRDILIHTPHLQKRTISFFALKFGIDASNFRAYQRQKDNPTWTD